MTEQNVKKVEKIEKVENVVNIKNIEKIEKVTVEDRFNLNNRRFWFDARKVKKEDTCLMDAVYNTFFDTIMLNLDQLNDFRLPTNFKRAVVISQKSDLLKLKQEDIVISMNFDILEEAKTKKMSTSYHQIVDNRESLDNSYLNAHLYDYLIVELVDETNIPLELILAKMQKKSKTQVMKIVDSCQSALITFGVMEVGSEGVILSTNKVEEIYNLSNVISESMKNKLNLVDLEVVSIQHIGMGNRSCIDTNSLLREDEGMIVGSTSQGGILVCSETHYLPYMNLRPFRVNAGSVSSYCWGPNNIAEYMTDLEAGSELLTVDLNGNARQVTVGRIKTEVRPLLLIKTAYKDFIIKTIVQDDWHVRVMGSKGEIRNVTTLRQGEKLRGMIGEPGRHVGIKVNETIYEK
jgi:3-dehydroquinate synthase II/3-amino-4-hydroxybenzoic acid synthase